MDQTVTINLRHVARGLGIPLRQVQSVIELLDEGNTVPFITRYRKDQTGGLDEEQIRQIQDRLEKMRLLAERKQTILRSVQSQGKLTESLQKQILGASSVKRLEDLYLPYKPKKQTLATQARQRGLEPLAQEILAAAPAAAELDTRAADFVNPDRDVKTPADALLGAGHILAEQFSEDAELRHALREILRRTGTLAVSQVANNDNAAKKSPPSEPSPAAGDATEAAKADASQTGSTNQSAGDQGNNPTAGSAAPAGEDPAAAGPSPSTATESTADSAPEKSDSPETAGSEAAEGSTDNPGHRAAGSGDDGGPTGTPPPDAESSHRQNPGADNDPAKSDDVASGRDPASDSTGNVPDGGQPENKPEGPPGNGAGAPPSAEAPGSPAAETSPAAKSSPGEDDSASSPPAEAPADESTLSDKPPESSTAESSTAESAAADSPAREPSAPKQAPAEAPPGPKSAAKKASPPAGDKGKKKLSRAELKKQKAQQRKQKARERKEKAFRDYFDYREEIKKIPPHRVLAINRGERAKILRVKIECDVEAMYQKMVELRVPDDHPHRDFLCGCARDGLSRLIVPALEREVRRELTDRAETHAVGVFAKNLRNLLLQPPIHDRRVLAVDPGFRSGCKLAALDQFGNLLDHAVIYLVGKDERREQARQKALELIRRFGLSVVAIGNGTACREAEDFFGELISSELNDQGVSYVIVNEAGASVYSTSQLGREEFPHFDATLRGAISIGRRLQDPLSELVKIDPANIGVGLYQHDVRAKHLRASLDEVVESCVNYVGVNVNTASPALLGYVSGLNQLTARRVYEHRMQRGPFRSREQLKDVPGFGEATFVQAAGFLKISGGPNPLDATWIHPESYPTADQVLAKLEHRPEDLQNQEAVAALAEQTRQIDASAVAAELNVGTWLLRDILAQFARPGRDPREDLPPPVFRKGVLKLEDLEPGMELTGTILNVVDFGAFVDIGMHDSGLVHVSQLAGRFVRDPHDVVAVGDIVKVWVISVDKQRRRVSLTMIPPGSKPDEKSRPGKPSGPSREKPPAKGKPRRPRDKGRDKGKGGGQRTARPKYRPKQRPKPAKPITDAMKKGDEPMRTFSDLAQFFQLRDSDRGSAEGGQDDAAQHKDKGNNSNNQDQ